MSFLTDFDPQVIGLDGYTPLPLVTIGETIPDTSGVLNASTAGDYQPVGILDGLGAIRYDEDTVRAFVNHELVDFDGVPYEVFDSNGNPFSLTGGRISYFDINVTSFEIEDAGLAYDKIVDANGNVVDDDSIFGQVFADPFGDRTLFRDVVGFSRFCSGGLSEAEQFGPGRGLADDIYFAGEETGGFFSGLGGANWALDIATGTIYQLPFLGRGSWENTSEIDTGTDTHVAFILADDQSPFDFDGDGENESPPFYLYVGEKIAGSDDFLERNGLTGGKLYVWVPDANLDADASNDILNALQFRNAGTTADGAWVEIENGPTTNGVPNPPSIDGTSGFDRDGFPTQSTLITRAEAAGAFFLSRPEDVATNPDNPSEIVQAVTGVDNAFIDPVTGNGADTFGALYTLDTDFSNLGTANPLTATAKVIYDGDEDPNRSLRSPDNLDWGQDGFIYVQEDEAEEDSLTGEVLFGEGAVNPNEASIVQVDPNATPEEAAVGDNVQTIAVVDRTQILDPSIPTPETAVDEDGANPGEAGSITVTDQAGNEVTLDGGEWETSGIVDASHLFDYEAGTVFLFDVQAHGLADQDEENLVEGNQSALSDDNLKEGGQLSVLFAPEALAGPLEEIGPAQVKGLQGYEVEPVFTIGQTFADSTGALNSTSEGDYTPPGILDGLGAFELDDSTVRVLANHELTPDDGYAYSLENGLELTGARVSYFDIDKDTLEVLDTGLAFNTIFDREGNEVTEATQINEGFTRVEGDEDIEGISRLCSSIYIPGDEFGAGRGITEGIYFTGEEDSSGFGGIEYALDPISGELYALPYLGRAAWENVTQLDTGDSSHIAILVGDDRRGAPLTLYIGEKDTSEGAGFLERNGLTGGKLYAWVSEDGTTDARGFLGTGSVLDGEFVEIPIFDPSQASDDGSTGYDSLGFATLDKQDELYAAAGAFQFSRPEDVATNPEDGTQAVLASTGTDRLFDAVDSWGTTYRIDVDFNDIAAGDISGLIDILYDGDAAEAFGGVPDAGLRSPDNLDWADDGLIYIQEDRSIGSFGDVTGEETSIWSLDPSAADTGASLKRIAQVDRSAVPDGQTDIDPDDLGDWETSGILDVSELFGWEPGDLLLFDAQSHSLRNGPIGLADVPSTSPQSDDANLVQGGQLAFLIAPDTESITETGSNGDDFFTPFDSDTSFDGVNDALYTGAGADEVDLALGATEGLTGGNRINTGSDDDIIAVSSRDRVSGSDGNDLFDAEFSGGYNRMSGGEGDDIFILGGDRDRALGGVGMDTFEILASATDNILSGGEDSDEFFFLPNGDAFDTTHHQIVDFEVGDDILSFGIGITDADVTTSDSGGSSTLAIFDQDIASFIGVSQADLDDAVATAFVS